MNSQHSITQYIEGLKSGDPVSAQKIWERFLDRLIRLADQKLKSSPRKAMNEEDVVQQAFAMFFRQVQQGRFVKLNDRHDLWQILAMLVDRRATDQIRKQNTQKAGGGNVNTESILIQIDHSKADGGIAKIPDASPTPELAAELMELFRQRMAALDDDEHRQIAELKMQGYSNSEIAESMDCALRTIERRLSQIRSVWSRAEKDESA